MNALLAKFNGKKTYITAFVAVSSALASYFMGDATLFQTIQVALTAILGATLRHGLATDIASAASTITQDIINKR